MRLRKIFYSFEMAALLTAYASLSRKREDSISADLKLAVSLLRMFWSFSGVILCAEGAF